MNAATIKNLVDESSEQRTSEQVIILMYLH